MRAQLRIAALLAASLLAFEGAARAQGTPPAATDPSRAATRTAAAKNSPEHVHARDTRTTGPIGTTHEPKTIWSRNSDPVIAERANAPGKFYDTRTGPNRRTGTINAADAKDAIERAGYYEKHKTVTLAKGEQELWNKAALEGKKGEFDKATGNGAEIGGCIACTDAKMSGTVGVMKNGVQASGEIEAGVYLAKVEGKAGAKYNGDVVQAGVGASGTAYVGAQGKAGGNLEISTERVTVNGKAEVFAGGKAEGQINGEVGLTNVGTAKGTLKGEVSYGIGASAEGYFTVDWSTMTFKGGGKLSATLGIGAGVGFQTEISVKPAVDWVAGKAVGAYNAVSSGVSSAASSIGNGAKAVANKLCFWCKEDPPTPTATIPPQTPLGNQTALNAPSAAIGLPPAVQQSSSAGKASGAGMSGALGR